MSLRSFIGDQEVVADSDALDLALDLYCGPAVAESDQERAARLDAGVDLLAEDSALFDHAVRVVIENLHKDIPSTMSSRRRGGLYEEVAV